MNRQPYQTPPRWWSPKPSTFWMRLWRPFRRRRSLRKHGLVDVKVGGLEHLASALAKDQGVLITPNHASHADPFVVLEASDQLRRPFYFMTAWQVFAMTHGLGRRVLRHHGCFSINREGYDVRAVRCAVRVLQDRKRPLVIFPEGEVFHLNDRVMPFRRGAATAAMLAAERSRRPVACVPCGLKFQFVDDPTPNLLTLTDRLEQAMLWTPRPSVPLARRVHRLIEGVVSLQEVAHLGGPQTGSVPDRLERLREVILARIENGFQLEPLEATIPERVKRLRFRLIQRREESATTESQLAQCDLDLAHLFTVMQLYSYPVEYVEGTPSLERLAETLDKLEEDVLGVPTAGVRGMRRAIVQFGPPQIVPAGEHSRSFAAELTGSLQDDVQRLVNDIGGCDESEQSARWVAANAKSRPNYAPLSASA